MINDPEAEAIFRQEADALTESLQSGLLTLKAAPEDAAVVAQVFRDLHTLKGTGAMFGFGRMAEFIHDFETAFEAVRDGRATVDDDLIRVSLRAHDIILDMLAGDDPDPAVEAEVLAALHRVQDPTGAPAPMAATPAPEAGGEGLRVSFTLPEDLLDIGGNPAALIAELTALGEGDPALSVCFEDLPPLAEMDPARLYLRWQVTLTGDVSAQDVEDVFLFHSDRMDLRIEPLGTPKPAPATPAPNTVHKTAARGTQKTPQTRVEDHIRVPATRLDGIMDQVGEMVIAEARLSALAAATGDAALADVAETITRLTAGLRDQAMALRMTPLSTITGRFHRLAHDLAESTGKPFDLQIVGEETELDKSLIEKLAEPLMHILRNAVDHGLETPEGRAAAGKPARGLVVIEARHSGADILIGISDDGRGLNPDMIRERAIENGLIAPTDQLSRDHLLSLILEPGFSTATQVTELSGRGIGTDVVNTMVRSMRGQVMIDTEEGQGTRFILRLPLTLAIVDGLLVQVGPERYVIPLAAVSAILDMPVGLDFGDSVAKVLPVRGELVSVLSLRRTFGIDVPPAKHPKMILVQSGEGHVGISVDRIIRVEQTVVKQLSPLHRDVQAFGGASVQPDGQIALILDVAALGHMHGRRAIRPSVEVPA